ncbi:DUF4190 domain-containing protein [Parvicella tangerina]|uniref:DUF4190 domain-containing protein n=1 Tax=Parvicella tangerina TaxID=2829795 RepID=A0A916JQ35_9FLAO|nr:DUF4190 domain-containing protein [Parvicella tangerina]CAG5086506.1 hypothetical protein CRYO30217_03149 [Parvicella tangerina]
MKAFITLLLLCLLAASCSIEKRHYNKGFYVKRQTIVNVPSNDAQSKVVSSKTLSKHKLVKNETPKAEEDALVISQKTEATNESPSTEIKPNLDTTACDKVIFRDGHKETCIVKEVTPTEIRYKKCGFEEGPLYTVKVPEVSAILYRNGTKEFYGNYVETTPYEGSEEYINGYTTWANDPREIEIFSVLSVVFATVFFIPGLSIVFGVIGLRMFNKEPGRYKGKGFAYVGIGLGAAWILLVLVMLLLI